MRRIISALTLGAMLAAYNVGLAEDINYKRMNKPESNILSQGIDEKIKRVLKIVPKEEDSVETLVSNANNCLSLDEPFCAYENYSLAQKKQAGFRDKKIEEGIIFGYINKTEYWLIGYNSSEYDSRSDLKCAEKLFDTSLNMAPRYGLIIKKSTIKDIGGRIVTGHLVNSERWLWNPRPLNIKYAKESFEAAKNSAYKYNLQKEFKNELKATENRINEETIIK